MLLACKRACVISVKIGDDRIRAVDNLDPAIPVQPRSKFLPNFGAGVYYAAYHDKWFAGLAIPRLVRNSIDFSEFGTEFSREVQHINAMGGMTFKPDKDLTITPQVLFKYAIGAPFDAEANVSALLKHKFLGGLTYRVGGDTNGLGKAWMLCWVFRQPIICFCVYLMILG